jgi:integrase
MAEAMYTSGSIYLKLQKALGKETTDYTLDEINSYLHSWILLRYGNLKTEELDPMQVQNDLLAMDRSNSWRNRIIYILDCILGEAVRNKMIKYKPQIPRFKHVIKRKKDILSQEEIEALFPEDFNALAKLWDIEEKETDTGFMFGTFFALMVFTGLRLCEAMAIHPEQLIVAHQNRIIPMVSPDGDEHLIHAGMSAHGIIIDRMYNGLVRQPLK